MTNLNKAITATIKSISEKKNLIFSFNNKFTKINGNKVFLTDSNLLKKRVDIQNYRGVADFLALKIKYHDDKIYEKFKPKNNVNREIFDTLEEIRIVALGSMHMRGIASNLKTRIDFFCKKKQFNKIKKRSNSQITHAIKLLLSEFFLDEKLPKNTISFVKLWKPIIIPLIIDELVEIKKEINDQINFSIKSLEIINKIQKFCEKKKLFEEKKKKN